jgi:hypothetical protein
MKEPIYLIPDINTVSKEEIQDDNYTWFLVSEPMYWRKENHLWMVC